MRILLAASAAILVLASGCYEQQLKVAVHEGGAGTIQVTERIAPGVKGDLREATRGEFEKHARPLLVDELASWEGVSAWTDASAKAEDGAILFAAKGWFDDAKRLRRDGLDGLTHRFDLDRAGDALRLTWTLAWRGDPGPDTIGRCRSIASSLKGTRIDASVTLPGALVEPDGSGEPSRRTASWVLFSGLALAEKLHQLELRLEAGALTEKEVVSAFQDELTRTITARCRVDESSSDARAFREELDRARATYVKSDLSREVDAAKLARPPVGPDFH